MSQPEVFTEYFRGWRFWEVAVTKRTVYENRYLEEAHDFRNWGREETYWPPSRPMLMRAPMRVRHEYAYESSNLYSTGYGASFVNSWTLGKRAEATCFCFNNVHNVNAQAVKQGDHPLWTKGHQCGIYAMKDKRWLLDESNGFVSYYLRKGLFRSVPPVSYSPFEPEEARSSFLLMGEVALWGAITEHALGFRAQYAYPLRFVQVPLLKQLPCFEVEKSLDFLSNAYRIPVERDKEADHKLNIQAFGWGGGFREF